MSTMWAAIKEAAAAHGLYHPSHHEEVGSPNHPNLDEALGSPKAVVAKLPGLPAPEAPAAGRFAPGSFLVMRAPTAEPAMRLTPAVDEFGSIPIRDAMSEVVEFETDLFVGKMQACFKLEPKDMCPRARELMAGKKRLIWVSLQGRVKRPVALEDLYCGQFFTRPLALPARVIVVPAMQWLGSRMVGIQFMLGGESPVIAGPLCAAAQLLNVSKVGEEPPLYGAPEDTRLLLGPEAAKGPPLTEWRRRRFFKRPENRAGRFWHPDQVITLGFFDHTIDYRDVKMHLPVGGWTIDMCHLMDGQPVDVAIRDVSTGEWAFRLEVWHKRMLEHEAENKERLEGQKEARAARLAAGGR